jgi:cell division protein FtsW
VARKLKSDRVLFTTTVLLVCVSVVMVYSASAVLAQDKYEQPYFYLYRQILWAAMGLAVLSIAMRIDYRTYRNEAFIWTLVAVVAVLLVAVFFREPVNNARRWLNYQGLGIQPSELAKIVAVLFAALMLERRMHRINDLSYSLTPIGIVTVALFTMIVLQPDYGTAISLLFIVAMMVFAAGLHYRYILTAGLMTLPILAWVLVSMDYRVRRFMAFLDPGADPLGSGFQIIQSQIALGTGGVFGLGLMAGVQKLFYLPYPHTDFIFAVIGEELGLIGTTATVICFAVIGWRGLRIAARAEDAFGALLAVGLTTMIAFQALVNMSVVLGLMPTKGIPLPFVSNGGSSLLVSLLAMGILLNISQHESANA